MKKTALYFFIYVICSSFNAKAQLNSDSILIVSYLEKGYNFEQTNIDSSIAYTTNAYKLANELKNKLLLCRATMRLGIMFQNISDYKKATIYYREGIRLAEELNNKELLAQSYNSFGNLFALQKQYPQAIEFFNKALAVSKEINDTRKVSVILMNLANIEYTKAYFSNDYKKCNEAYKEAYDWAVMAKDTGQQISCLGNWGMSYSDEENFNLSLEKLTKGIDLAKSANHQSDLVFLYYYLGRTYGSMKQHEKALESFSQSLKLAFEFKDVDYQAENYYCMAESNYEIGHYKEAYDFFEKYKTTEDTLTNKELASELSTIKAKYDTEKKQKEIELLKVNANKDKITKISLSVGAVMLLLLAFLLFNRYRLKSKTNSLLEYQNSIISEKNKDISDSINYAKKIQDAILPSLSEIKKVFPESFILSIPKDVVSGDFYWFTQHQHLKLFVVADCTGHGVPGAFMSMIGNTLLNSIVIERKIFTPNIILNELRKEIISVLKQGEGSQNKDGMDISLICFNTQTNILEVACANNPVWILKNDRTLVEIKPDKQPIGYVSSNQNDFTLQTIALEKGDVIYQFTDGYADQFGGEKGKKYKYQQLKETLVEIRNSSIKIQSEILNQKFVNWKGKLEQIDDVLVTGIRVS